MWITSIKELNTNIPALPGMAAGLLVVIGLVLIQLGT